MSGIGQYLKDTRGELRHVAWPTQSQTILYTVLVVLISIGIAVYLGFFDFLFTTSLSRVLGAVPGASASPITITQQPATSTDTTDAPSSATPDFTIPGTGSTPSTP